MLSNTFLKINKRTPSHSRVEVGFLISEPTVNNHNCDSITVEVRISDGVGIIYDKSLGSSRVVSENLRNSIIIKVTITLITLLNQRYLLRSGKRTLTLNRNAFSRDKKTSH